MRGRVGERYLTPVGTVWIWKMMMEMRGSITADSLAALADRIGVETEPVLNRMNTDSVTDVLRANRQLAEIMAIQGTPTFIIGDEMLRGMPRAGLAATIEAIRDGA